MGADSITLKKSYHDKSPAPPMERMELISFTVDKIGDFGACGESITKDLTFTAVYTKGTEIYKYVNHEIPNYNQITCIEGDTSVLNLSEPSITLGKQESEVSTPYYYKFQYVSAVNNAHKMTADLSFKHYGKDGELSEELISTDYSNICLSVNYNSVDYNNCNNDDTIIVDSDQVKSLRLSAYMTATNKYVVNGDCGSSSEREETVEITNGFIFEIVGETNGLSISNNILTVPLNKSGKETKTTIVAKYPNAYNISKESYIIVPPIIEDAIQIVATCDLTKALDGTSWFIKTERCMDGVKIEKIVRESATSSYVKFAFDSTKIKSWKLFSGFTQVVETNKVRQLAGSATFRGRSEGATYIHSGISGQTVRFKCFCFQNRNNDSWAGKDANVLRVQMFVLGKIEYE